MLVVARCGLFSGAEEQGVDDVAQPLWQRSPSSHGASTSR